MERTHIQEATVVLQLFLKSVDLLPEISTLRQVSLLQLGHGSHLLIKLRLQLLHLLQKLCVILLGLALNINLLLHELFCLLQKS